MPVLLTTYYSLRTTYYLQLTTHSLLLTQLATGTSMCENEQEESECLVFMFKVVFIVAPDMMQFRLEVQTLGAWIEPLNFRNFAVVNPSFGIGFFHQNLCVVPCPSLGMPKWHLTLFWKKPSRKDWPKELYDRRQCVWRLPTPSAYYPFMSPSYPLYTLPLHVAIQPPLHTTPMCHLPIPCAYYLFISVHLHRFPSSM